MGVSDLVLQLRKYVQDERYVVPAFSIMSKDRLATDAHVEVAHGRISTVVINGGETAREINLSLTDAQTATVGLLVDHIKRTFDRQYSIEASTDFEFDHPAYDLAPGMHDINRKSVMLHTRRFSDQELYEFLAQACMRHNPGYSPESCPFQESNLVLQLARAEVLRVEATNAAKRRGLEVDAGTLLELAASFEAAYDKDMRRVSRAIPSPAGAEDTNTRGDVVVSEMSRFSMRTGYAAPVSANTPPKPIVLFQPEGSDVEDYAVSISWQKPIVPSEQHQRIEIWRDTHPDVQRSRDPELYPTTSKCVWTSDGSSRNKQGIGSVSNTGANVTTLLDGFVLMSHVDGRPVSAQGALEPSTTYYYRAYNFDTAGEYSASDTIRVTTKPARAEFAREAGVQAITPNEGPRVGGTEVTVLGSGFSAANPVITIGGKEVIGLTVVSDTEVTFTTPATSARGDALKDVVITSATGLRDVSLQAWRYTED